MFLAFARCSCERKISSIAEGTGACSGRSSMEKVALLLLKKEGELVKDDEDVDLDMVPMQNGKKGFTEQK